MSEYKEKFDEMLDSLKQLRDEVKVKMHLGKAEARDEWERLEEKWQDFKSRTKVIAGEAGESAKDLGSALELVGEELKEGYKRIRKLL